MSEGMNPYETQGQQMQRQNGYSGSNGSSGYSHSGGNGGNRDGGYGGSSSYQGRGRSSGGYGGYGNNRNGYRGGSGNGSSFQKREYTEEDLRNARLPVSVVISGNEHIPDQPAQALARIAKAFEDRGIVVRTGGLSGSDDVVISAIGSPELHLPFKTFNKREASTPQSSQYSNEVCTELARRHQRDLDSLPKIQKSILAKNPRLLFGKYLTAPAQLVILWSEDGCFNPTTVTPRSGNAGHIVKLACASGIRVINIQQPNAEQQAFAFLESMNVQEQSVQSQQPTQQSAQGYSSGGNQGNPGYQPQQPYAGNGGGSGQGGYGQPGGGDQQGYSY